MRLDDKWKYIFEAEFSTDIQVIWVVKYESSIKRFILGGNKSTTVWYLKMQFLVEIIQQERKFILEEEKFGKTGNGMRSKIWPRDIDA